MKVAYAVVSWSLWMMFPSSADIPRAPRNAAWPKREEKSEQWVAVGGLPPHWVSADTFSCSYGLDHHCRAVQMNTAWWGPTTVWSSLGLKLTVSHFSEKYWASFMWPDSVGSRENWRSPWWTVSDVKWANLWPSRCGAQDRYTTHLIVDETERGKTLPPGGEY